MCVWVHCSWNHTTKRIRNFIACRYKRKIYYLMVVQVLFPPVASQFSVFEGSLPGCWWDMNTVFFRFASWQKRWSWQGFAEHGRKRWHCPTGGHSQCSFSLGIGWIVPLLILMCVERGTWHPEVYCTRLRGKINIHNSLSIGSVDIAYP